MFHANSSAWIHAHTETCHHLGKLIYSAIIDQSDYIVGDGNKFAQRNFKEDSHSDYRTCIIVDMLCRILKNINSTRSYENRITYDIVSSSSHYEWLASPIGKDNDTDCLIAISLHYGKQQVMKIARCKEPNYTKNYPCEGFPHKAEVIMIEKERPKYIRPIDIGLRQGDCDYHSPLLTTSFETIEHEAPARSRKDQRTEKNFKTERNAVAENIYLTNSERKLCESQELCTQCYKRSTTIIRLQVSSIQPYFAVADAGVDRSFSPLYRKLVCT